MKNIEIKFQIGQIVFLKTDKDQEERIITEIWIKPGAVQYYVILDTLGSWHYDFELSTERDIIKATKN